MTGVMLPAAAYADPGDPHGGRHERSEQSDNSSTARSQRVEHSERSNNDAPRIRMERAERPVRVERVDRNVEQVQTAQPTRVRRFEQQGQQTEQVRTYEGRRDRNAGGFLGGLQQAGREQAARNRGEVVTRDHNWSGSRDGDRNWSRDRDHNWSGDRDRYRRWSSNWRDDHRYDWRSYRNRYSSLYRLGRYYDPYGYSYRRFSIGFSLGSGYYGSNYWLNDPWQYRLPPAYGPYRWVRYYDDALLVNIYDGQVVDVIYNFFW
jgi:hypothetical protein